MAVEHKHDAVTTQRVGALKTAEPLASQKAVTGNEAAPTDTIKSGKLDSAEVRDDGAGHCGRRCLLCDIARADCAPRSSARARGSECRHAARHTCAPVLRSCISVPSAVRWSRRCANAAADATDDRLLPELVAAMRVHGHQQCGQTILMPRARVISSCNVVWCCAHASWSALVTRARSAWRVCMLTGAGAPGEGAAQC
jgi:hypothetical protein